MYSLYVYDEDLLRQGVVEDIDSLQWLSLYAGAGEVKLVCAATDKNLDLLRRGRRLWCTEQPESAVIAQIEISDTGEKATMTVRAPLSTNRWARRVAMWTTLVKNVETAMYKLVNDNRRGLPGASAKPMGLTPVTDSQTSWGSVLESLEELAEAHGLGFRETFDPATGVEMFCVYQGTDRSSEGSDAFVGYLGDDIGNLADIRIVDSDADWKNVAVVGGQDQGADRKVVTVALGSWAGDERRELWVDAKDISTSYQVATPTGEVDEDGNPEYSYTKHTYTDAEYEALLRVRGLEKLAEKIKKLEVTADAGQDLMYYGEDYFLGDVLPLKLTRYGLRLAARLTGVRTIYEASGRNVVLQLGDISILQEV